jgi:hypothetical protein
MSSKVVDFVKIISNEIVCVLGEVAQWWSSGLPHCR